MSEVQFGFLVCFGLVAIWFGWRVFRTSSMVRSALSLLASMAAMGAMFLAMEAEFLGVLQLMMMAAEMCIMAVFMMMYMMDPGGMGQMDMTHQPKAAAAGGVAAGITAAAVAVLAFHGSTIPAAPSPGAQNHDLGIELMTRSMMLFETAGVSILVAMISATATALAYKTNQQEN
ncbi:NADH-quinone oxidoreductase subunit J family protein [Pontibacter chitinilyticus]|uniref:NADH-quinone oxidoreductase subunit J family protein n=1 Tax=Pontibacter chitinilyticus TaxID=2674989 RepID=UPI0032196046